MANQIPDNALEAIEEAVRRHPDGASAQEILRSLASPIPLRTLQYRLKSLVTRNRLIMDGEGRWAKYRISDSARVRRVEVNPDNMPNLLAQVWAAKA